MGSGFFAISSQPNITIKGDEMLLRALAAAAGLTLALNTAQAAEPRFELDLEVQELESTLKDLAAQADVKLRYAGELLRGKTAPVLRGRHSLRQALDRLLDGTELSYQVSPQGVVTIKQRGSASNASSQNGNAFQLLELKVTASQMPGYHTLPAMARTATSPRPRPIRP